MATILLSEASKLGYDDLSAGVADAVITADGFLPMLPFNMMTGNAYAFNREGTPGNVASLAIGGATTDVKTQVTFDPVTLALTSIIGDAEVNGLIAAQGVGTTAGADPIAAAIASKAKQVGREYARQVAVGNATTPTTSVSGVTNTAEFDGIETLLASSAFASQVIDKADAALTLDMLDELIYAVTKGDAEFIMGTGAAIRKIRSLLRALGGTSAVEINGKVYDAFNGVPLIRNDYLTSDVDGVTAGVQTNIYAGLFDDGTRTMGVSGVLPTDAQAISVTPVGPAEAGDYDIYRVKMYGAFAIHSVKAIAQLKSVTV